MLTAEEKQSLWLTKLNSILSQDPSMTAERKAIVSEIRDFLLKFGMKALVDQPSLGENLLNNRLAIWEEKFTRPELMLLVTCPYFAKKFSLKESEAMLASLQSQSLAAPAGNCTCYYNVSCGYGKSCVTKDATCTKKAECGLFGTSNCTGTCQ